MKKIYFTSFLFLFIIQYDSLYSQSAGFNSTYIILQLNAATNYYDLQATSSNPDFQSSTLGAFGPNNTLSLKGAEHNVWKCGGCDLTSTRLNYRIYLTNSPSGSYSTISIPYSSGGNNGCGGQDQQWKSSANAINLIAGLTIEGNYTIEVYSEATITCGGFTYASNGGNNYKATFDYFNTSTWDGTAWSKGAPTSSLNAIIAGNFSTTELGDTAGFTTKTLTVNTTKTFTINTGHNVTVAGAITNNGTFTVANNANLVQTNVTAVTNTGNIIVNRNSASIQLYDYTLWSSPVTNANQFLTTFSPNTLATRFYTYNSTAYHPVSSPSTTPFAAGTGYLIRAPNNWAASTPTTFNGVFTGVPNNGTITLSGLTADTFYAIGNPYPSTISANLFISGNSTGGTLYFWRKTNNASNSSYATYTTAGGVANSGGSSAIVPDGTIQVGQGFIVKTGASTLSFTNAMRTSNSSSPFLRTTEEKSRFWLNLSSATGYFCQTLVAYMPEATPGVDNAIDGPYFNDSPTALTSIIEQSEFTIQGKPLPFDTNDTVPLGFKTNAAGNYTIGIDHVDGLFSNGQTIFLKDNLVNTTVNLTQGAYTFSSEVGVFNSRFEIVYQSALVLPTFTANNVVVYSQNGDVTINSGTTPMDQVRIFDVRGRLLAERSGVHATEIKLNIGAQNQVLLVKITTENGSVVTKKIIQ